MGKGRISRGRLIQRVADALDSGSVILTAGAGSGKTTLVEQALDRAGIASAWVSCTDADRAPGVLLVHVVDAIAGAVPGATEATSARLATAPEAVDAVAASAELVAELGRLLVDPLALVIDDAEWIDGSGAIELASGLIRAESSPLRVVLASRLALALRIAKPAVAGRVAELGAGDLAFDAEECAALLANASGAQAGPAEVEAVLVATEGWALGVELAARRLAADRGSEAGEPLTDLGSEPALRTYLSEELLDSLEPSLRQAVIESSVEPTVSPALATALGLPGDLASRAERAGLLVRELGGEDGFAYHPLLRELLLERLRDETDPGRMRRVRIVAAEVARMAGAPADAIEHLLAAEAWADAAAAIGRDGPAVLRTSPESIRRWLGMLPADVRGAPAMLALAGQLDWLGGDNPAAIVALERALEAFPEHPDSGGEWVARSILVDALFASGDPDAMLAAVDGWRSAEAAAAGPLAPATAMYASAALAACARFEESERLAVAAAEHPGGLPSLTEPFEALRAVYAQTPEGRAEEARRKLETAAAELGRFDPMNRRHHVLGALAASLADAGRPEESLAMWRRIREGIRGGAAPVLADATHGWCALLHARCGQLAEAEGELGRYRRVETGARAYVAGLAPATVAAAGGDPEATVEWSLRTREIVASGPELFRYLACVDLVAPLISVARTDLADEVLNETMELVDRCYPGPRGGLARARLLGHRSRRRRDDGDRDGSDTDLLAAWNAAAEALPVLLRRDWGHLQGLVSDALETGLLEPAATIARLSAAFPERLQLVAFLDHPVAEVRAAALGPAVLSGHPDALAAEAAERGLNPARPPPAIPPRRFQVLGAFALRRGAWSIGDDGWERPIDARLVRFLLASGGAPVSEDLICEALWPDLTVDGARRSLQVAASRTRRVLNPPGGRPSAIERIAAGYRLALGANDVVDADEFHRAAAAALEATGPERAELLERARALWGGEPLPEERYSDWAAAFRERLNDTYVGVLTALARLYESRGDHSRATDAARELVTFDPLNEAAHRELMTAYARTGRRGQALRQYLECRRELVDALGVEPAAETARLQARILAGEPV